MDAAEVDAVLGEAVRPLDPPLRYGGAQATREVSAIEVGGGWMRYDPAQEIDPLVPDIQRRLHARRSYPQRLLVRYYPSARTDLMSESCGALDWPVIRQISLHFPPFLVVRSRRFGASG